MKIIRVLSRIIVGTTFVFSGVVKAIDPLGYAYKIHDYFLAFHLSFLTFLSLILAIAFCIVEFVAGFSILTGLRQKTGIWIALILMLFFTPLTFILALTNPVSDCGCFGDAIHLTNWQTFGKNIILLVPVIFLFIYRRSSKQIFGTFIEWLMVFAAIALFILFSLYNLRYLPVIDFLPYKTGIKIVDGMVLPEGAAVDKYNTTFIYEKDGAKKEFTLNDYPANDTSWKFVEQRSVLVKKGTKPPIHDFSITSLVGENVTEKVLSKSGYSVLMISKKLSEAQRKPMEKGFEFGRYCTEKGIGFYVLTSSGLGEIKGFSNGLGFYFTDETTLKTMVRANPGYILLKDGTIVGKWSGANLPGSEYFDKLFAGIR
jgi:hypothetical protein